MLIDTTTANANHLSVGSVVPVTFAQTGASTVRVGGIFKSNPLIGSYVVGAGFFDSHFHSPLPIGVLIRERPGATHVEAAINRYLASTRTSGYSPAPSSSNPSSTPSTRSSD